MSEMTNPSTQTIRSGPPAEASDAPRTIAISAALAVALLALFYAGVFVLPPVVRAVATHNLYNYRLTVEKAVAQGEYERALAVIERAARRLPRDIYFERPEFMYTWIGEIWQKQGDAGRSLDAFLQAQAWHFRNIALRGYLPTPKLIRDIIESYFALGRPEAAYHEARAALDFYPMLSAQILQTHKAHARQDLRIERDLALLDAKLGRYSESRSRLQQCLAGNAALPGVHYALGRIAELWQQSPQPAIAEYERELAINPFNENAAGRLAMLYPALHGGRPPDLAPFRARAKAALVAEFVGPAPGKALATFFSVGARVERTFELAQPGTALLNIRASSTPCDRLYGWVDVRLDGAHVQTLYLDGPEPFTHEVRVPIKTAGPHRLEIENLTDAMRPGEDRNAVIHAVRVYRVDS